MVSDSYMRPQLIMVFNLYVHLLYLKIIMLWDPFILTWFSLSLSIYIDIYIYIRIYFTLQFSGSFLLFFIDLILAFSAKLGECFQFQ